MGPSLVRKHADIQPNFIFTTNSSRILADSSGFLAELIRFQPTAADSSWLGFVLQNPADWNLEERFQPSGMRRSQLDYQPNLTPTPKVGGARHYIRHVIIRARTTAARFLCE